MDRAGDRLSGAHHCTVRSNMGRFFLTKRVIFVPALQLIAEVGSQTNDTPVRLPRTFYLTTTSTRRASAFIAPVSVASDGLINSIELAGMSAETNAV
jgi:hypothetical protein